jgi:hypothetical protein
MTKAMNKEDRKSHITTVQSHLAYFSAFCDHVSQTMNLQKEKALLCWDGSGKYDPLIWVMNDDVDMEKEPQSLSVLHR